MPILAPLLIPLATALLLVLLPDQSRGQRRGRLLAALLGSLALVAAAAALFAAVWSDEARVLSLALGLTPGDWPLPYGIEVVADPLSAGFILVTALLGLAVQIYALGQTSELAGSPLVPGLLAGVCAVFLAADLFNLYVWFELILVATLGLMVGRGGRRETEAAFKYLTLNLLGTLLLLAAVALIYGITGHLNLAALAATPNEAVHPYLALLLLALLFKAGALPLFAWLPGSYPALSPAALALVGGLLTKVAVYVLLRLGGQVFPLPPAWLEALGWLALATMAAGALGAAYHWDLRRILALHIVSQVGYLLLGLALATPAGAAASAFFTVHNILVKANLFLIAGLMAAQAGHFDLRRIGGLSVARPMLALLFAISALSLVGLPPSSGFWGKFLLVREAFALGHYAWGGGALAVGLLTLYSMSKIWLEGFWKPHPGTTPEAAANPAGAGAAYGAVIGLSLLILALGLAPDPFIQWAQGATQDLFVTGAQP